MTLNLSYSLEAVPDIKDTKRIDICGLVRAGAFGCHKTSSDFYLFPTENLY